MCVGVDSSTWTRASSSVSEGNQLNASCPGSPPLEPRKPLAARAGLLTDRTRVRAHNLRFSEFLRAVALSCVEDAAWQQSSPSSALIVFVSPPHHFSSSITGRCFDKDTQFSAWNFPITYLPHSGQLWVSVSMSVHHERSLSDEGWVLYQATKALCLHSNLITRTCMYVYYVLYIIYTHICVIHIYIYMFV